MAGSGTAHLRDGAEELLLRVEHLVVEYRASGRKSRRADGTVYAVSDLSFDLLLGETLGLVGESGCGKSTTGSAIMMLTRPSSGRVIFQGRDLGQETPAQLRRTRGAMHIVFQDPISALNARRKVRDIVAEGLVIRKERKPWTARIDEAMLAVGLDPAVVGDRRPRELSGGQCQRVALARALVLDPALIVCDEPVSALDVSVQAQILNLLAAMKARYAPAMLFISHDLAVVKHTSDRVAVMYLGKLCEIAPSELLYAHPAHPYTRGLLSAIPHPDPSAPLEPLEIRGDLPSPTHPPAGCRFHTRCPRAQERCAVEEPVVRELEPEHFVACHFPDASPNPSACSTAG